MNRADRQRTINENLQLVRFSNRSGSHTGCVRYFPNNTDAHEDTKWEICKFLARAGREFITEAIFDSGEIYDRWGGRADIFVLDKGIVIEVLESETEEQFKEKVKKYPESLEVFGVDKDNWKKELGFLGG